ncbi:MAG: type II toxin-antitoxin system HicB family antitoxin [Armatimonadota bacterium]
MKKYNVPVLVEMDEDGKYIVSCPSLEGCYSQGDTFEEAMKNIKDVIKICLEEVEQSKKVINLRYPEIIGVKYLEIAV